MGSFPSPFLSCEVAALVLPSFSPQGVQRCNIDVPPPDRVGAFCPVCLCVRVCVCVCVCSRRGLTFFGPASVGICAFYNLYYIYIIVFLVASVERL